MVCGCVADYRHSSRQKPNLINNRVAHTLTVNCTHSYTTPEKKEQSFCEQMHSTKTWGRKFHFKCIQIPIPIIQTKRPLLITKLLCRWPWTSLSLPPSALCLLPLVWSGLDRLCSPLWPHMVLSLLWIDPFSPLDHRLAPLLFPDRHLLQTGLISPDPPLAVDWSSLLPLIPISSFCGYS